MADRPSPEPPTIQEIITSRFPELSGQQRKAAQFVLDHQDEVAMRSMRDLATDAGLPAVTFVRLARALGFEGYDPFRDCFKDKVRSRGGKSQYALGARNIQAGREKSGAANLIRSVFAADLDNIQKTYDRNPPDLLDAAKALEQAERVFVLGQRSCFSVAYLFHYMARLFRHDTLLLSGTVNLADDLRGIGPGDVILVISIEPYGADVVKGARYAISKGASCIAITDKHLSPVARLADIVLLATCDTPSFFHSMTAISTLLQALLALLVSRGGKRAVAAIQESELQLDHFGAYWSDTGSDDV